MPLSPTVFVLSDPSLVATGAADVVPVTPGRLVETIRASGAPRWLLLGRGPEAAIVAGFAAEVLSGAVPVFGLAGLVVDAVPARTPTGLPTLLLADGQDPMPAAARFWHDHAGRGPIVPADFAAMIASDRVSARTRGIHARRALADDPAYVATALAPDGLATLRALAERVVPQDDPEHSIDLAARVDAQLARGEGDGWRHADLPSDLAAYRAALDELAGLAALTPGEQDDVLSLVAAGERASAGRLSAEQLSLWFEDARNDLVRQWVAHPATMARIGYDGLANGGDGERKQGFVRLGAGEREDWEPAMTREVGR